MTTKRSLYIGAGIAVCVIAIAWAGWSVEEARIDASGGPTWEQTSSPAGARSLYEMARDVTPLTQEEADQIRDRINLRIPEEIRMLSDEELVNTIPDSSDHVRELNLRARTYGPDRLNNLVDLIRARCAAEYAEEGDPVRYLSLVGMFAMRCLPPQPGDSLLIEKFDSLEAQDLDPRERHVVRRVFVGEDVRPTRPLSEEMGHALFELYRRLEGEIAEGVIAPGGGAGELLSNMRMLFGHFGEVGVDYLREVGWRNDTGIRGLGYTGRPEAADLLWEFYWDTDSTRYQARCLRALAELSYRGLNAELQTTLRDHLPAMLDASSVTAQRTAIAAMQRTEDSYYIPYLEAYIEDELGWDALPEGRERELREGVTDVARDAVEQLQRDRAAEQEALEERRAERISQIERNITQMEMLLQATQQQFEEQAAYVEELQARMERPEDFPGQPHPVNRRYFDQQMWKLNGLAGRLGGFERRLENHREMLEQAGD